MKLLKNQFLILTLLLITSASSSIYGQSVNRVEIESNKYEATPNIIPVGKLGVIVFNASNESFRDDNKENMTNWIFNLYDENFNLSWNKVFPIRKKSTLIKFKTDDKYLYLLFSEEAKKPDLQVIQIGIQNGSFNTILSTADKNTIYTDMEVLNQQVFFSGYTFPTRGQIMGKTYLAMCACYIPMFIPGYLIPPAEARLCHASFNNSKVETLPISYQGKYNSISQLSKGGDKVYALVTSANKKELAKLYLEEYNNAGIRTSFTEVKQDEMRPITDGHITNVSEDKKVMIGVYSKFNTGKPGRTRSTGFASGMYFTSFSNNSQSNIKYYDFSDFKTFWNSVETRFTARQTKRMKKKKKRREEKGKNFNVGYRLLVHDIIKKDSQLIMLAEAYYPEYHTETYYTTDANGRTVMRTRQVFDGFRYTHAIIAGFNTDGTKLWDHSFGIGDILDFNLRERVKVLLKEDEIVMAYSNGGYITSKILKDDAISDGERSVPIETGDDADQVKRNYKASNIAFWYDNYFISSGVQKIKNKEKRGSERKKVVFYFNKIEY